jgi:radical SAM-linked protein
MRVRDSSIPAEALARQARLQAVLREMEDKSPSREAACLRDLRAAIAGRSSFECEAGIKSIAAENLVEEAYETCRSSRRDAADQALLEVLAFRLAPLAARAQQQRSARWQLDTRRTLIRFAYKKGGAALGFDDRDLHAIFLQAFRLEGLRLLLDLGKRPRPLLGAGLPLPAGVGGLAESMDAVLRAEPEDDPEDLMARLNQRLPEGLHLHQWLALPGYASPVSELALLSHWQWEVPIDQSPLVRDRIASFLATSRWPWERGASHSDEPMDLRDLVPEIHWEASTLCCATRMGAQQAVNPLKLLGAITGLPTSSIVGLVRVAVELKVDARLSQADRFQPKLKNMYEDAVLLGGGSNIVLIDEDDDEPIRLGPHGEPP